MKNKIIVLTILLALAVSILGCKQSVKYDSDAIVLRIWETYGEDEHKLFREIAKEYEKEMEKDGKKIKIDILQIPFGGHQSKILTGALTRTTPDIGRVDVAFVVKLAAKNAIVSLDEYGAQSIEKRFVKAAINSNKVRLKNKTGNWEEKIYGIPDQITGVCLFYNDVLFKKAGLTRAPGTWEEFVEYGKKLTDKANQRYGCALVSSLWWNFPFFNTYGVKFLSDDKKKCLLNSAETKAAMQMRVDLSLTHKIEYESWRAGSLSPDIVFPNGQAAMILSGPWNLSKFRAIEKKKKDFKFKVALIPSGTHGTSTNVGGTNMVVFKTSKHPKEAYNFLNYLSSKKTQVKWCNKLGQIPVNLKAYPEIKIGKEPALRVFMEQMKTAKARPQVLEYGQLETIINPEMEATLSGQKTVEKALNDAVKRIEAEVLNLE